MNFGTFKHPVYGLMNYIRLFLIFYTFLSAAIATKATETIRLATEIIRSLNQKRQPNLKSAFANLEISNEITSMPWARSQLATKYGNYDGFFMASRNDKRDQYAVLSEPFSISTGCMLLKRKVS